MNCFHDGTDRLGRLAFFVMTDNVVIMCADLSLVPAEISNVNVRALQGMIKEFCFFIFLAAICFSGLLFTLWKLGQFTCSNGRSSYSTALSSGWNVDGQVNRVRHVFDRQAAGLIRRSWLMVQIW